MKQSLRLTGEGIARALGRIAELPAVDRAVRERAERVASDMGATRILRRGSGDYVVTVNPNSREERVGESATPPAVMPAKAGIQ